MNMEERAKEAVELKNTPGINCCQAVAMALADETPFDREQMRQLGAGFGGGMGTMEGTCGALVGAGMVAGLKSGGSGTQKLTRQMAGSFKQTCGAVTCKDIKGVATGKVLCSCDDCVKNAVLIYSDVMGED